MWCAELSSTEINDLPELQKLTQVYSRYPCEKSLIEKVSVRTG